MSLILKQSTAVTIVLGPFVDSVDAVTPETALTISQADIRLTKNGASFAQSHNVAGATHMEAGRYSVPLDATDTDTLGRLRIDVAMPGALPVWENYMIVCANVYDSLVGGSDSLEVDAVAISGSSAAADNVEASIANLDAAVSTRLAAAGYTAPDNAGIAAIKAKTDNLPADPVDVSDLPSEAPTPAEIDLQLSTSHGVGSWEGGGTAPTAAQVADAVWDEILGAHVGAGSTGEALNAAGGAGDPWITALPGAYGPGQAGNILGNLEGEIWSHDERTLTQSAAAVAAALAGSTITILRGDTLSVALTGLGSLAGRTKLWFTLKANQIVGDSGALVQITEGAGLVCLNGAAAEDADHGAITVDDPAGGNITVRLEAVEAAKLSPAVNLSWDVQMLSASGVHTLTNGTANIVADTTRNTE